GPCPAPSRRCRASYAVADELGAVALRRRRRERNAAPRVPRHRHRLRRARRGIRGRRPRHLGGRHSPRRVHLGGGPVRRDRRRALVPRLRRTAADRTDGDDVGAVDPLPAPGPRRAAVLPRRPRVGEPAQRGRHRARVVRRPHREGHVDRPGHVRDPARTLIVANRTGRGDVLTVMHPHMLRTAAAVVIAGLLSLAACSGDDDGSSPAPDAATATADPTATAEPTAPAAAGDDTITISGFAFSGVTEVPVGTTVIVTNDDTANHTWTATDGSFDSGSLAP